MRARRPRGCDTSEARNDRRATIIFRPVEPSWRAATRSRSSAAPGSMPTARGRPELLLVCQPACRQSAPRAQSASCVELAASASRSHGDLAEVEAEWKAFERQADRTASSRSTGSPAWQQHIGARSGSIPAIVFGRDGDGQLLFILQLAIERAWTDPAPHLARIGAVRLQRAAAGRGFLAQRERRALSAGSGDEVVGTAAGRRRASAST